jgi:hypothetical protein
MNMFRTLRADEIDCRIAQIKETPKGKGLSLLLYKDARCDQNILDEVVGPFNWKREHTRDNRNCIVSIKNPDNGEWVSKEDTGTESNTEREKGLASDSFKRACFNWGIGRELYTAPFIWITEKDCNIKESRGKLVCYDRFTVKGIGYTDGVITGLEIKNQATGKICYKWGEINEEAPEKPEQPDDEPEQVKPINQDAPATVEVASKIPERTPETEFLLTAMKGLRENRGITAAENKKLFNQQKAALVAAKMAPDKPTEDYTLEELESLIDAMYKNFAPTGTELKIG